MLAIFHEHPDWFRPLFAELDRRGVPYTRLDAARLGAARATVAGSSVLLPAERRLGSLEAAAAYAARVLALPDVVHIDPREEGGSSQPQLVVKY